MSYKKNCKCGRDGKHVHGYTATGIELVSTTCRGLDAMAARRKTYLVDYYRSNAAR